MAPGVWPGRGAVSLGRDSHMRPLKLTEVLSTVFAPWRFGFVLVLMAALYAQTGIDPQLLQAAQDGNSEAQTALAYHYYKGDGVEKNYAEALHWFHSAADLGNAFAQAGLGLMYWVGEGVPQNDVQALSWFRKAANQGEPISQYLMCVAYSAGRGVLQDRTLATEWCVKA